MRTLKVRTGEDTRAKGVVVRTLEAQVAMIRREAAGGRLLLDVLFGNKLRRREPFVSLLAK